MKYFVNADSIVRKIWGRADTTLFIFAGSAAEFALNKAVDWLYYTGKLPADPLGRLFSTVTYARQIIFSEEEDALRAIDKITALHLGVEQSRGARIPDWAYRDVLFMLIDYSIRSFELLDRPLTIAEKTEIFNVFYRLGLRMGLTGMPINFVQWKRMREEHLQQNLVQSAYTNHLYKQYKKHLGWLRYKLVVEVQGMLVPEHVNHLLDLGNPGWIKPILATYRFLRRIKMETVVRDVLLPAEYKVQIKALDR